MLPLSKNPVPAYLARLSTVRSRRAMLSCLDRLASMLLPGELLLDGAVEIAWHELRYSHVAALRAQLAERYAPATVNVHLSALRGVLGEAWRLELLSAEDFYRATDVQQVPGRRLPSGRALASGEIAELFLSCKNDPRVLRGRRDRAALALLFGCGLRRAELVQLELADLNPSDWTVRVRGKGDRERLAYLPAGTQYSVLSWCELRGGEDGPLIMPLSSGSKAIEWRRLSTPALWSILERRARYAKVARCSPHDLRRTFVTRLLDAGCDLSLVSRLAGHRQLQTTQLYDRRDAPELRKAVELLHVPAL